ncbi:MAG: BREX system serine/threonine kinase PglW, partial [Mycobacterium sp.]
ARPPSATTMHTRNPTTIPPTTPTTSEATRGGADQHTILRRSVAEHGFMAIGVPVPPDRPSQHERVARELAEAYDGQLVNITTGLIDAMRALARQQGVSWELIRSADAAEATPLDARGLRTVIDRVVPQLWQELEANVFDGDPSPQPLILTDVSPLARYGHLDVLAKLSDLAAPRRRPVWVILPQLRGQHAALVDRKPIQLGSPGGQFIVWKPGTDLVTARGDQGVM